MLCKAIAYYSSYFKKDLRFLKFLPLLKWYDFDPEKDMLFVSYYKHWIDQ